MKTETEKIQLKALARKSIEYGVRNGKLMPVRPEEFDLSFREIRACFVTLRRAGQLRGCIGSLEARQTLVEDVVENAYAAACLDPRFEPVQAAELEDLEIRISILSPHSPIHVDSEQALLRKLRPGVDGLVLEHGSRRATFLPAVWQELPQPTDFLAHLKRKAGLDAMDWDPKFRFYRYRAEEF